MFSVKACHFPMPLQVAFLQDWRHIRLNFTTNSKLFNADSLCPNSLYQLGLLADLFFDPADQDKTNALVVASKQLKQLRLRTNIRFHASFGRIPAIKALTVATNWPYTSAEIPKIWDFSQLTSLFVGGEVASAFFKTVHPQSIPAVKSLDVHSFDLLDEDEPSFYTSVSKFIEGLGSGLQDVSIAVGLPSRVIDSVTKHGSSLRELSFPAIQNSEEYITAENIIKLHISCPDLVVRRISCSFGLYRKLSTRKILACS